MAKCVLHCQISVLPADVNLNNQHDECTYNYKLFDFFSVSKYFSGYWLNS